MDNKTSTVFELMAKGYVEDILLSKMEVDNGVKVTIDSVKILSQSVVVTEDEQERGGDGGSEPAAEVEEEGSGELVRKRRKLSEIPSWGTRNTRRLETFLKVDLAINGQIEQLDPNVDFDPSATLGTIDEEVQSGLETEEFLIFIQNTVPVLKPVDQPLPINGAVSSDEESTSDSNTIMIIIIGGSVAVAILVASILFMERNSRYTRRRRAIVDEDRIDGYDLEGLDAGRDDAVVEVNDVENGESKNENESDLKNEQLANAKSNDLSPRSNSGVDSKKQQSNARMKSLLDLEDKSSENTSKQGSGTKSSGLNMSPTALKAAVKQRKSNIFVFTEGKRSLPQKDGDEIIEIKHSVSSLSNPSNIEELPSPSPLGGYLGGDAFDYQNAEKMIGDQIDTRAILTPFTPRSKGNRTSGRKTNYSFSSPVNGKDRSDKLFDIFAPPGPLGIIIDTTPEGPMIHSLKPTSQLLGLVNPGDLIVGLDGVDTRNMTAATFTRLMAKRSQGERKITLLKGLAPLTPTSPS